MSRLSSTASAAYRDPENSLFISVASIWEIIVKNRLGKLALPRPVDEMLRPLTAAGAAEVLSLNGSAVMKLTNLPDIHRDPFDRMLVCQAIDEDMTLVTPDATIAAYPVKSRW